MAVRSQRLWVPRTIAAAATWTVIYTVPAGRTVRASLFTIANPTGSTSAGGFGLGPVGAPSVVWWGSFPGGVTHFAAGLCFNPGDQILGYNGVANTLWFGGYGSLLLGSPS